MLLDGKHYKPKTLEEAINKGVGYLQYLQEGTNLINNMSFQRISHYL